MLEYKDFKRMTDLLYKYDSMCAKYDEPAEILGLDLDRLINPFFDALMDSVLDCMEVPEDNTVELGLEHPDCFCRDTFNNYLYDLIDDYSEKNTEIAYNKILKGLDEIYRGE